MKLSEMNTVELAKALCDLAEPVSRLISDKELMQAFGEKGKQKETLGDMLGKQFPKVIPSLLDAHFADVVAILAVLTGKTADSIRAQKGVETIRDIRECFSRDLMEFFAPPAAKAPAEQ